MIEKCFEPPLANTASDERMRIITVLALFLTVVLLNIGCVPSLSTSICQKGEQPFIVLNVYNMNVYADGMEIKTNIFVALYNVHFQTVAFCIPSATRVLAVTNVLDQSPGVYLLGSIRGKLVTNRDWKCVEHTFDVGWYRMAYDDSKWPHAHAFPTAVASVPNISVDALPISASSQLSNKFYCRAWVNERTGVIGELFTRSAYAVKSRAKQRLNFHVVQSFVVISLLDCIVRCLDYEDCVSVNFETSQTAVDQLKTCELNSKIAKNSPEYIWVDKHFDYYDIIKP